MQAVEFTTFKNRSTPEGTLHRETWPQLVQRLSRWHVLPFFQAEFAELSASDKKAADKAKDTGAIALTTFLNNSRAAGSIATAINGLTYDFDEITAAELDQLKANLAGAGLSYLLYSTASHTDNAPRVRVLLPLARAIRPEDFHRAYKAAAVMLSLPAFDNQCNEPKRIVYRPTRCKDTPVLFHFNDLAPLLDPEALPVLPEDPPQAPAAPPRTPAEASGLLPYCIPQEQALAAVRNYVQREGERLA